MLSNQSIPPSDSDKVSLRGVKDTEGARWPGRRVLLLSQLLLLWLIIIARCFLFNDFANNEVDVLPSARQQAEGEWLPGDWYLNREIGYRMVFNGMVGPLISSLGFIYGAVVGRLLLYLLFATAVLYFFRTFNIRFAFGLLLLILFLNNQSLIAGEWMAGGLETKAVAWPLALFAIAAFARKNWSLGLATAGAALSFHILVGIYLLPCIGLALLLNRKEYPIGKILKRGWIFVLTGSWGLYAIVRQLIAGSGGGEGWSIYVNLRVPHHVLPDLWKGSFWIVELLVGVFAAILLLRIARSPQLRFFAALVLGSAFLFGIGLIIWLAGVTDLLRFYWFRFPDTVIPFAVAMMIALLLSYLFERYPAGGSVQESAGDSLARSRSRSWSRMKQGGELALIGLLLVLSVSEIVRKIQTFDPVLGWGATPYVPMFDWIGENTPKNATFMIDPAMQEFYVRAERSLFVSFKHSPQSAEDMVEWYRRLVLCNGGIPLEGKGFGAAKKIKENFYQLDSAHIAVIAKEYGINYYLGKTDQSLPFERIHQEGEFTLYRVQ
ncbi:MAG: hypothetical protein KDD67_12605 [Ignavibacteriae bacterium]|nr:hypothetical protein [Ignavibacteriota bacterium]MCB9214315.1 hypothetical protein [Ignavibacteria bacterium]